MFSVSNFSDFEYVSIFQNTFTQLTNNNMSGEIKAGNIQWRGREIFFLITRLYTLLTATIIWKRNLGCFLDFSLWCIKKQKKIKTRYHYWKRNQSLKSFLESCKDIGNLLLWVLWECLIMNINDDSIIFFAFGINS